MKKFDGKKAQIYPVFLAFFATVLLTLAYVAITNSHSIKTDSGEDAYIGEKQSQVFYALQDAEGIKLFVDQAAKLAVEKSLDDIKSSCSYKSGMEEEESKIEAECGVYVHSMWSTSEKLCLPDCKLSFEGSFKERLNEELSKYFLATGTAIPSDYSLTFEPKDNRFYIRGVSRQKIVLKSLPPLIRKQTFPAEIVQGYNQVAPSATATPKTYWVQKEVLTKPGVAVDLRYFGIVPCTDRSGTKIAKIVLHHTGGGTVSSAVSTWSNINGDASAHYIIDKDGTIYYIIDESLKSNHAGCRQSTADCDVGTRCPICRIYPPPATNSGSIGIEIINNGYISDKYTGAQYEAIQKLIEDIGKRYDIQITDDNVISHYQITSDKWDPSPNFEWSRIGLNGHPTFGMIANGCSGIKTFGYSSDCIIRNNAVTGNILAGSATLAANQLDSSQKNQLMKDDSSSYSGEQNSGNTITGAVDGPAVEVYEADRKLLSNNVTPSKYSFNTKFTVVVNKKLDNPIQELTDWTKRTWDECDDDLQTCLNNHVADFNKQEKRNFDMMPASECEEMPKKLFFDFIESVEDCMSNGQFGCSQSSCDFNFSNYNSDKNLTIRLDPTSATVYSLEKEDDGSIKSTKVDGGYYGFYWGEINKYSSEAIDVKISFKDEIVESVKVFGVSKSDSGSESETLLSDSADSIKLVKTKSVENENNVAGFTSASNDEFPNCLPKKDKFRLCAKPLEGKTGLFPVKFSLQLKDKPPKKACENGIEVIPVTKKSDDLVGSIAEAKGFDLLSILSIIPIPALQLGTTAIAIADVMNNLPDSQAASLQVICKNDDSIASQDIIGYEVSCNGFGVSGSQLDKPNAFVMIKDRVINQTEINNNYFPKNPYQNFLDGKDCQVPVVGKSGLVTKVPAILGQSERTITSFNIGKCGENVLFDKIIKNNYCVTLVPVDKNGQRMTEQLTTSCAQTNSLVDMAIKRLLETQLKTIVTIPPGLIPKDLEKYIKLPSTIDLKDVVNGDKAFDLSSVIDTSSIQSELGSFAGQTILKNAAKEVAGSALSETLTKLNPDQKEKVLSEVSNQITNPDAERLFDKIIFESTQQTQSAAMKEATQMLGEASTDKILSKAEHSPQAISTAKPMLEKSLTLAEKKDVISQVAEKKPAAKQLLSNMVPADCKKEAVECLNDESIKVAYSTMLEDNDLKLETYKLSREKLTVAGKTSLVREIMNKNPGGVLQGAVRQELKSLPQNEKRDFIMKTMQTKQIDATEVTGLLQKEITKALPEVNSNILTNVLKNKDFDFLKTDLESELKKQFDSFIKGECKRIDGAQSKS